MNEWSEKGLVKHQQDLPGLDNYVIQVTSKEDLLVIDQHTREVEVPITWINSRELEFSNADGILTRVLITNQWIGKGVNSICNTSYFKCLDKD